METAKPYCFVGDVNDDEVYCYCLVCSNPIFHEKNAYRDINNNAVCSESCRDDSNFE